MQTHLSIVHSPIKNATISGTPEVRVNDTECTLLEFLVRDNRHLSTLGLVTKYNKRGGGKVGR